MDGSQGTKTVRGLPQPLMKSIELNSSGRAKGCLERLGHSQFPLIFRAGADLIEFKLLTDIWVPFL